MDSNTHAGMAPARLTTESVARSVAVTDNRIDSRELFAGERELLIDHGTDTYRLRLTFQNKLILTK